jgi:hypothetical protein
VVDRRLGEKALEDRPSFPPKQGAGNPPLFTPNVGFVDLED